MWRKYDPFGVLDFYESPCLSRRNTWLYGNVSCVCYSSKHGAAHRGVLQLGHMYIVRRTILRKAHKWHLRLVLCLGKWRPTNRVGGLTRREMLLVGSNFNNDLTTSNRNEGNDVCPSLFILYKAWALDRLRQQGEKIACDTTSLFFSLFPL